MNLFRFKKIIAKFEIFNLLLYTIINIDFPNNPSSEKYFKMKKMKKSNNVWILYGIALHYIKNVKLKLIKQKF
jgi:hypothetical protein